MKSILVCLVSREAIEKRGVLAGAAAAGIDSACEAGTRPASVSPGVSVWSIFWSRGSVIPGFLQDKSKCCVRQLIYV